MVGIVTRLRIHDRVVGYKKLVGNYTFFSKDFFRWSGDRIHYTFEEGCTHLINDHGIPIFENDVVRATLLGQRTFFHVCKGSDEKFDLIDLSSIRRTSAFKFDRKTHFKALFPGFADLKINQSILRNLLTVKADES